MPADSSDTALSLTHDIDQARRGQRLGAYAVLLSIVVTAIMAVAFHAGSGFLALDAMAVTVLFAATANVKRLEKRQDEHRDG